jgi:hypothetical protein
MVIIADGVLDAAELRVGKDPHAELVDVRRTAGYRYIRCPGDAACPAKQGSDRLAGR